MSSHHLVGRMPHNEIEELFRAAARAKSHDDTAALNKKLRHVARVFSQVLCDFRATLPRSEEKRGLPPIQENLPEAPEDEEWRVIADTFPEGHAAQAEFRPWSNIREKTLRDWRDPTVDGYDKRAAAIVTLVVHDQLGTVRRLSDAGVNIRKFFGLPSHVGGGLIEFIEQNVALYIWMNQLLLIRESPVPRSVDDVDVNDAQRVRLLAALYALYEATSAYDNREWREGAHVVALYDAWKAGTLTLDEVFLYVKERVFPELVRLSHVLLYNAVRHYGVAFEALTVGYSTGGSGGARSDSAGSSQRGGEAIAFGFEAVAYRVIGQHLRKAVAPFEGVRREELFCDEEVERNSDY